MALRVLAYLTVFLGMALCAEAYYLCLAGERLSCTPPEDTDDDENRCNNITDPGPLWIKTCAEHENACFNASHMYMEGGYSYENLTFGCIYADDDNDNCEKGESVLEMKHPVASLGFKLFKEELNERGVTISNEIFETCVCKDENCNGMLQEREIADNNNRASSVVWPVIIGAMVATVALIAIGAAVSLCA